MSPVFSVVSYDEYILILYSSRHLLGRDTVAISLLYFQTYGFKMTKEETKEFVSVVFTGVELTSPTGSNQEMDYFPFLRGPWYPKYREILHLKERYI